VQFYDKKRLSAHLIELPKYFNNALCGAAKKNVLSHLRVSRMSEGKHLGSFIQKHYSFVV